MFHRVLHTRLEDLKTSSEKKKTGHFEAFNYSCYFRVSHTIYYQNKHCMKRVRIRSFSGPYFLAFGLNPDRYTSHLSSVSLRIQSKCGKIRTGKTPNMDTFHRVKSS